MGAILSKYVACPSYVTQFQEPRSASSGSPMTSHSSPSSPGGTVWHRPSGADYQGHFY